MAKNRFRNIDPKDREALKGAVEQLKTTAPKHLNNAICDIIDLGGYSIAVLVDSMPDLEEELQLAVIKKLEDFFYFHPEKGSKLFDRIHKTMPLARESCRKHMLAILSDIADAQDDGGALMSALSDDAVELLKTDADLMRMSKAIEISMQNQRKDSIPHIISLMTRSLENLDKYQNYQFIETALLAMKRLGGEPMLRLMINPDSSDALQMLRLARQDSTEVLSPEVLHALEAVDSDFAQVMLKVIELSDFGLPFAAMIDEGLKHPDKWVRQAAAGSMEKAAQGLEPEALYRLLNDDAPEVRLMAVTSLGAFSAEKTGEILEGLALKDTETMDIKLNALYAMYSQRNSKGLAAAAGGSDQKVKVNALGLGALLMPHSEALEFILDLYGGTHERLLDDVLHYFLEIVEPEDIHRLICAHGAASGSTRERLLDLIHIVLEKKAGPRMESAISKLPAGEQESIKLLKPASGKKYEDISSYNEGELGVSAEHDCSCGCEGHDHCCH